MTDCSWSVLSASLILGALFPRVAPAQTTTIIATVRDTTGTPVVGCRIEVIGIQTAGVGDRLGRVVLQHIPPGHQQLRVRAIGYFERILQIDARGDTLRLPPVVLRRNPIFDSLRIVAPTHTGSTTVPSQKLAPNMRLKLAGRGGRSVGKGSLLNAAAPARSLSAIR